MLMRGWIELCRVRTLEEKPRAEGSIEGLCGVCDAKMRDVRGRKREFDAEGDEEVRGNIVGNAGQSGSM
jgi:hypothetical protein